MLFQVNDVNGARYRIEADSVSWGEGLRFKRGDVVVAMFVRFANWIDITPKEVLAADPPPSLDMGVQHFNHGIGS